jgi:hypothetical protein
MNPVCPVCHPPEDRNVLPFDPPPIPEPYRPSYPVWVAECDAWLDRLGPGLSTRDFPAIDFSIYWRTYTTPRQAAINALSHSPKGGAS